MVRFSSLGLCLDSFSASARELKRLNSHLDGPIPLHKEGQLGTSKNSKLHIQKLLGPFLRNIGAEVLIAFSDMTCLLVKDVRQQLALGIRTIVVAVDTQRIVEPTSRCGYRCAGRSIPIEIS